MRDPDPKLVDQTIDLTNCDREPIHILGRVQSYGCLIAVSSDWIVAHASTNCHDILGHAAEALVGQMKTLRPDISLAMIEERFMARFPPHAQDVLLRGLRLAGLT